VIDGMRIQIRIRWYVSRFPLLDNWRVIGWITNKLYLLYTARIVEYPPLRGPDNVLTTVRSLRLAYFVNLILKHSSRTHLALVSALVLSSS
jgi:hypothetical protein